MAAKGPVLLVVEDVHWADATTLEALDTLIVSAPELRLLIVLTARPEVAARWIGRPDLTVIVLERLSQAERLRMVMGVAGANELPTTVAAEIAARADGVPLFIEELTKAILEGGLSPNADKRVQEASRGAHTIPATLQASLVSRLDRLKRGREVAPIAATLGRTFTYEILSAVADLPQPRLEQGLDELESAELVFREGVPPRAEYTFKHALVQDAAYETQLRERRQHLHEHIATTLEDSFPEFASSQPALLAHHFAAAGRSEKAVSYWLEGGRRAIERSAMTEAVSLLEKGLGALAAIPEEAIRARQELGLRLAHGRALLAAKGYAAPEVAETFSRATALAEALHSVEDLIPILYGQWT